MIKVITQEDEKVKYAGFLNALERWEVCKPPYTGTHMRICVTAARIILQYQGKIQRSKYEKDSYRRIEFSQSGKTVLYAEFPKKMGLKGRKLGC